MKSIIIDPDAQSDIRQASDWYDSQRAGLSTEFASGTSPAAALPTNSLGHATGLMIEVGK